MARWSLAIDGPLVDFAEVFGRRAPVVLDIGFGAGEATVAMALDDPDRDVVAVEVHTPGIANVLDAIEQRAMANVRVADGDVKEFLARVGPGTLDEVRVFFPDPWPKVRQRHRRLVQAGFVETVADRLTCGGRLHLATDTADYAGQMAAVCDASPELAGGVVPRPGHRPVTRFEQRGLDQGWVPTDLVYIRR